ncbi:MAG TPA: prephenate dehydratase domain-containing protein [Candidatus Saccharibacteria bacterium]|nr:prephenate dehydratase domain-containing protein [Candidatus Saccharibacteria bacterium]
MRIAIQGDIASFHHTAALQWHGTDTEVVSCDSFDEVFGVLNRREAELGIVAIENSLYGGINHVYDLIESHRYPIVGEIHLPVHQQLIGSPDATITHIYSHPVALAQCQEYLDTHCPEATRVEYHDTAAAVGFIKQQGVPGYAAIAGHQAAELHNMPIIAKDIEDNPANFTRFLVVQPGGTPPKGANRTSLVITTNHTPGALAGVLTQFAAYNINLSKLQSRPIIGQPWRYRFYLVLDAAGEQLRAALKEIEPLTESLTILGEYEHRL